MTGQPPFGGLPFGMLTEPETASSVPCGVRDVYRTSLVWAALVSGTSPPAGRCQIKVP
jgi:hypothetical protein